MATIDSTFESCWNDVEVAMTLRTPVPEAIAMRDRIGGAAKMHTHPVAHGGMDGNTAGDMQEVCFKTFPSAPFAGKERLRPFFVGLSMLNVHATNLEAIKGKSKLEVELIWCNAA